MAKAKRKKHQVHRKGAAPPRGSAWDDQTREIPKSEVRNPHVPPPERWDDQELYERRKPIGDFTPGEIGEIDEKDKQVGEANRQTDESAELEDQANPDKDLPED